MACHDAAAFGIFANLANAEAAIDGLTMAGFFESGSFRPAVRQG
jgi:hypothetical protein